MAETTNTEANAVPALPPPGEMVKNSTALLVQYQMWRNTLAFGGTKDPSSIWNSMVRGDASEFVYYREIEEKDDDVANGSRELRLNVLSRQYSVLPGDETSKAKEVADFIQAQIDGLPNFYAVLDCLLDAPAYGFTVQELIFDTSMGQASLVDVNDCPQELFLFGDRYYPQIGPLQFLDNPYASTGQLVPEQKFLIYSYDSRSRNRKGRPMIRSVYWMSWFKRNLLRFWLRYAEKGPGTAVVRYKDGADDNERRQAVQDAEALVNSIAMAVPENFQYEKDLLQVARSQDPDTYDKLFQRLQYGITRRMQGQTLTSFGNEGGTGSKAQGQVHQDTLDQIGRGIAMGAQSVINRQLVRPLVLWNFGPDAPIPKWVLQLEEEDDQGEKMEIISGAQRMGITIPEKWARETFGIPTPAPEEPVLTPNISAPQVNETMDVRGTFSEAAAPAIVRREHSEFDRLFSQLATESRKDFATRAKEVAAATTEGAR